MTNSSWKGFSHCTNSFKSFICKMTSGLLVGNEGMKLYIVMMGIHSLIPPFPTKGQPDERCLFVPFQLFRDYLYLKKHKL